MKHAQKFGALKDLAKSIVAGSRSSRLDSDAIPGLLRHQQSELAVRLLDLLQADPGIAGRRIGQPEEHVFFKQFIMKLVVELFRLR